MTPDPEPVFAEPWQAQAFALVVSLHQRGLFTWTQWAQALSQHIAQAQACGDPDHGNTYYAHWLAALEALLQQHGVAQAGELQAWAQAWEEAAEATPHGQAIPTPNAPGTPRRVEPTL